jgi:hypothetical protein
MKNVQFCILPDLSIVMSWSHRDDALGTKIIKYNIDDELQSILKSTEMVPVMGPVHSLLPLKGETKQNVSVTLNNSNKIFKCMCSVILNLILKQEGHHVFR